MDIPGAISAIKEIIAEIDLEPNQLLDEFDRTEPVIYLCGKSTSGKTTFLNALLNREKDELFTSTDISTRTEFRFQYNSKASYQIDNNKSELLPNTYSERKELFYELNQGDSYYTIGLPEEALKGRTIVDIPGVFDFSRASNFSKKLIIEADAILFLTPCIGKISAEEYNLLKELSGIGISLIIVFTMGDITDPDEGVSKKTLSRYIQKRKKAEFENIDIHAHFIVSAINFFKGKKTHGIDTLLSHIEFNDSYYFSNAQIGRIKRLLNYYIELLNPQIIILIENAEQIKNFTQRENAIWLNKEVTKFSNDIESKVKAISRRLDHLSNQCKESIVGYFLKKETYEENADSAARKEAFILLWNNFWTELQKEYPELITETPKLKNMPGGLFSNPDFDYSKIEDIIEKLESHTRSTDTKKPSFAELLTGFATEYYTSLGFTPKNAKLFINSFIYLKNVSEDINITKESIILNSETMIEEENKRLKIEAGERTTESLAEDNTVIKLSNFKSAVSKLNKV